MATPTALNPVSVRSLLLVAAAGNNVVPTDWMPASQLRPLALNDPGILWLEQYGAAHGLKPDLPSPYAFFDFVADKNDQFKTTWLRKLAKDAAQVCEQSYHVRYASKLRVTLELLLEQKAPVVVQPALWWAPEKIYGCPDLLVHTSWLSKRFPQAYGELVAASSGAEPEGYVLVDLALRRDQESKHRGASEAQIRFNTYILGHLQSWMPPLSFLINRDHVDRPQPIPIESALDAPLDQDLSILRDQFRDIVQQGASLAPWRDAQVSINLREDSARWSTAKQRIAWEMTSGSDPRLLPQIGDEQKQQFADLGFNSIATMLEAEPDAIPAVKGITGVTAARLQAVLQANRSGQPVLPAPGTTPQERPFEFYVDFEYFNNLNVDFKRNWPELRGCEMLFMIGVGQHKEGSWSFCTFIAENEHPDAEKKIIDDFVDYLQAETGTAALDSQKTALYHWSNAEQWQSKKAADRHALPADHPLRHLPWVDLRDVFRGSEGGTPCAMPGAWDYSLKHIARALEHLQPELDPGWVGDLDDGSDAMVIGWQAYRKDKPLSSDEMRMLKHYLEADCRALSHILRWMRAGTPGAAFGPPWPPRVAPPMTPERPVAFGAGTTAYLHPENSRDAFLYLQPVLGQTKGIKAVEHLIWGDKVEILESEGDWRKVLARNAVGWLNQSLLSSQQLLEVNFVDVGQGDGCLIVTPDDRIVLVDAGEKNHMARFLRWRYRHFQEPLTINAAVITHPDLDHFGGFLEFFRTDEPDVANVRFATIYHNGIFRANSKSTMQIVKDKAELKSALSGASTASPYVRLLKQAMDSGRVDDFRMLCAEPEGIAYLPGYGHDQRLAIQVLGPVPSGPPGSPKLPWFGEEGKTKNGNSVVLRIVYDQVSILLGGDLNIPAEEHLLRRYSGIDVALKKLTDQQRREMIDKARQVLQSDIAKSCHHGSSDFSSEFLRAVNPLATVVSSGDQESYSHPQPDTLGTLGKWGRGDRPLIFSTELARSAEEKIEHPWKLRQQIELAARTGKEIELLEQLRHDLGRSVAVYGMISVRTDGRRVLFAQKLEQKSPDGRKWNLHQLLPDATGQLRYESKHAN